MARRVSLPKADDLFRPTGSPEPAAAPERATERTPAPAEPVAQTAPKSSGRVKHDAKMTVYITDDELLDIEHARLSLRRSHGVAVDRGRLVREAVALALADLESNGEQSALVRRLREA